MSRKIQNPNYTSPKKDRRTAKNVLTAITILILVIGIFLLLFVRCNSSQIPFKVGIKDNGAGQISNGILQSGDAEKIRAEFQKKVDENQLSIRINSNPVFDKDCKKGNIRIENVPQNRYNQQVTITLDKDGKEVYVSPLLKPNQYIEFASLTKQLSPGDYKATALFQAYDSEDNFIGQVAAGITLTVGE